MTAVHGCSHSSLTFIQQPSNSIRAASSASPGFSPRNEFVEGRRIIPPSFGEPPGDIAPWFSRQQGEAMFGQINQLMEMVADREEWRYCRRESHRRTSGSPLGSERTSSRSSIEDIDLR